MIGERKKSHTNFMQNFLETVNLEDQKGEGCYDFGRSEWHRLEEWEVSSQDFDQY
jgi:hypothetical protein